MSLLERFLPYKKRAEEKFPYPEVFQFGEDNRAVILRGLLQLPEGQMLYRVIVEEIDRLNDYATAPEHAHNSLAVAHANGGVHHLRQLMRRLEQYAVPPPPKKTT